MEVKSLSRNFTEFCVFIFNENTSNVLLAHSEYTITDLFVWLLTQQKYIPTDLNNGFLVTS